MKVQPTILIPIQISSPRFAVYLTNLRFCLAAVSQQTCPCETVLIDYISNIAYVETLNSIASEYSISYVREDRKDTLWARGRALNCGIRHAKGNYVLFVDADCIMPPNYVESHINNAKTGHFTYSKFYNTAPGVKKCSEYAQLMSQKEMILPPLLDCESHQGIWKSDVENVGYFDDVYRGWGAEDNDLFLRLRRAGINPVYVDAMLVHLYHPTWQELMREDGKNEIQDRTLAENRHRLDMFRKTGIKK